MRNKLKEFEIDGETYIFGMLRPRISIKLLKQITQMFGPSIGKAFPKAIKIKEIFDSDIDIGNALIEFSNKLDEIEEQDMIDILFTQVSHKGQGALSDKLVYDNLFTGKLKHLFKVVLKALGVQYADFLPDDKDPLQAIIEKSQELNN